MAITYNGTPVTSVLMNGVTYTTIADENGLLYYACNPVCYYGNATVDYRFVGFDYCGGTGTRYARAIVDICGRPRSYSNAYVCWVGGPRTCNTNMCYDTCMELQFSCTHIQVIGCTTCCGVNYTFDLTMNPQPVQLQVCECGRWLDTTIKICPTDACKNMQCYFWNCEGRNCRLYSPWIRIFNTEEGRLECQGMYYVCKPLLLPYCAHLDAILKTETGSTEVNCSYVLNPLGGTTCCITSCIQVC